MSSYLPQILADQSTEEYQIFYGSHHFINHMAHGIIALARLHASNERLDRFANWYGPQLKPGRAKGYTDSPEVMKKSIPDLLGKYDGYYKILDHYKSTLDNEYGKSLEKFIVGVFPTIAPGLSGGAFHGLIHLGYGYAAKNPLIVCEGMTYLHYMYDRPVLSDAVLSAPIVEGKEDPFKVLEEVRKRKDIYEIGRAHPEVPPRTYFVVQQEGILVHEKACKDLLEYAKRIKLPKPDDKLALGDILLDLALTIYVTSTRRNDFFLLHGCTSAWALKQLLPLFKDNQAFTALCYHTFLTTLLATYVNVTAPECKASLLTDACTTDWTWEKIIARTLAEDHDEHVFKLVQVAHDMALEHPTNEHLYKAAALTVLDHTFPHFNEPYPGKEYND